MVVSVDDPANTNLPPNDLREQQRLERHAELIVGDELVPGDEADGDELRRFSTPF